MNNALGQLEALNQQASDLLKNGTINPNELNEYSALILDAVQDARPLVEDPNDEGSVPKVRSSITTAEQNKHALDSMWKHWLPIKKQLEHIGQKQEDLSKLVDSSGLQSVEEAKNSLDKLKVSLKNIPPIELTFSPPVKNSTHCNQNLTT